MCQIRIAEHDIVEGSSAATGRRLLRRELFDLLHDPLHHHWTAFLIFVPCIRTKTQQKGYHWLNIA